MQSNGLQTTIFEQFLKFTNEQQKIQKEHNLQYNNQHINNLKALQDSISSGIKDIMHSFDKLTNKTDEKLGLGSTLKNASTLPTLPKNILKFILSIYFGVL